MDSRTQFESELELLKKFKLSQLSDQVLKRVGLSAYHYAVNHSPTTT
jgi:hypothetical protein